MDDLTLTPPDEAKTLRWSPARALLVEDDPVTATIVARILERAFSTQTSLAATAEAAAELLIAPGWDLVMIDIGLPGASGLDLLRASTRRNPGVAHVIMSGRSGTDDVVAAMRDGADDYLIKPVDRRALEETVSRVAARRARAGGERVLAIGAHPDDVEIGVGGTLRRHASSADSVTILTLTGGERGGESSRRAEEAARAAGILGAELVLESLEDTRLSSDPATIEVIVGVVQRIQPTIIYTHTDKDVHQDHRSTHQATMVAARQVPRVYTYQAPSTSIDFRPSRFVQIGPYFEAKLDSIRAHGSQSARSYLDEDLLRSTARYWGRFAGGGLVEAFEVARETDASVGTGSLELVRAPLELERQS